MATQEQLRAATGDFVEVSSRRVGDHGRLGEILEVLGPPDQRPHFLVRWEDGHESILYPGEATRVLPRGLRMPPPLRALEVAPPDRLVALLQEHGLEFELLPHRRTTSATREARVLGVVEQVVAKTVVARDEEGRHIRAVVPASERLDLAKLAEAVHARAVHLLTEAELVADYPQFELGAVPPFGGPGGDPVIVDRRLAGADRVVLEAGVHDVSLRVAAKDLVTACEAVVADIATG
jgi:Ala-tRNA(Pro) deacylase